MLPTTPFVLLAAACFARSSPRFHERLRENRFVGLYLRQWQRERTVPRAAKRKAYGLIVLSFSLSICLVDLEWLRWTLAGVGAALIALLAFLPTVPRKADRGSSRGWRPWFRPRGCTSSPIAPFTKDTAGPGRQLAERHRAKRGA